MSAEKISPETLFVTHICDGEEVVMGGLDGQVWVATFASERVARYFVNVAKDNLFHVTGERRTAQGKDGSNK